MMHICHLSLYPDAYCSVMLDVTDDQTFFAGTSRDQRLLVLWKSYREWAERSGNVFWWFLMFPTRSTEYGFSFTSNIALIYIWLYQIWINPLQGVPDRASKKLFTKDILLPGAGKFPEPSQKIVSATASRYFIFWASSMIQDLVRQWGNQTTEYMLHQSWSYFLWNAHKIFHTIIS